jgi:alpha-L-fucosidase 2
MSLDLGSDELSLLPTDIRVTNNKNEQAGGRPDRSLITLFVQFGRYLLISSSWGGSQPANLQGIWNDKLQPNWER